MTMRNTDLLVTSSKERPLEDDTALRTFFDYMSELDDRPSRDYPRPTFPAQQEKAIDSMPTVDIGENVPFSVTDNFDSASNYSFVAPYGVMGELSRTKDPKRIEDIAQYCAEQAKYFALLGDHDRSRLFSRRAQMAAGVLDGTTKISGQL